MTTHSLTYPNATDAITAQDAVTAVGPDLRMYSAPGRGFVLYHTAAGLLGTFDDPAEAWSALDALDMAEA